MTESALNHNSRFYVRPTDQQQVREAGIAPEGATIPTAPPRALQLGCKQRHHHHPRFLCLGRLNRLSHVRRWRWRGVGRRRHSRQRSVT